MRFTLERPKIIKDAENSRRMFKKLNNKVVIFILECLLFAVVFEILQFIYLFVAGIGAMAGYMATNASNITDMSAESLRQGLQNWEFFVPANLIIEVVLSALFVLFAFVWQKRKPSTLGFVKHNAIRDYAIGLVAGLAMFSLAVGIIVITGAGKLSVASNINFGIIAVWAVGWFFQGMAEEVACRGFLLTSMARKNNLVVAILGNALFFAALHLGNDGIGVLPFINLTLFGVVASIYYIKSGNIWLVSAMHSIWNMVQGNLYGIQVSGMENCPTIFNCSFEGSKSIINGGAFGAEGGLAVTIVLVIAIVIGLLLPSWAKKD